MTDDEYDNIEAELSEALAANAYLTRRVLVLEQIIIDMTKRPEETFADLKWMIIDEFLARKQLKYTGLKR